MNRTAPREDRRQLLLEEAARLFDAHGYDRTSVRQLADAVGLQSGSLFHHFDSKESILLAVLEHTIELMIERLAAAAAAPGDSRQRLEALIRAELELLHGATRHGVAVAFFQWRSLSTQSQQQILKLRERYETIWLEALELAHRDGLIVTDPFLTRRLLTGAHGWTIYWYRPDGSLDLDRLAEEVGRLLTRQ